MKTLLSYAVRVKAIRHLRCSPGNVMQCIRIYWGDYWEAALPRDFCINHCVRPPHD